MTIPFRQIPHHLLSTGTHISVAGHSDSGRTTVDDPATRVFTDFRFVRPFSIGHASTISQTSDRMIACGVRLLFVTENNDDLIGLVTSTDLLGEKPVKYIQEHGGIREDILVQDIMTPHNRLEALALAEIRHAHVGDVVETMKSIGRQHMLVVDMDQLGNEVIVGLLAISQIEKQLNIKIELSSRANTFADLERALHEA